MFSLSPENSKASEIKSHVVGPLIREPPRLASAQGGAVLQLAGDVLHRVQVPDTRGLGPLYQLGKVDW